MLYPVVPNLSCFCLIFHLLYLCRPIWQSWYWFYTCQLNLWSGLYFIFITEAQFPISLFQNMDMLVTVMETFFEMLSFIVSTSSVSKKKKNQPFLSGFENESWSVIRHCGFSMQFKAFCHLHSQKPYLLVSRFSVALLCFTGFESGCIILSSTFSQIIHISFYSFSEVSKRCRVFKKCLLLLNTYE